jgi:hypothetical protein
MGRRKAPNTTRPRKIKRKSAKGKARRLQHWVVDRISEITGIESGKDAQIESREMGQAGVDVKLYGMAKEKFPFSVECKYQETWSIPAWTEQAKANKAKGTDWLLFVRRNRIDELVVMDAKAFFDIYSQYLTMLYGKNHKMMG